MLSSNRIAAVHHRRDSITDGKNRTTRGVQHNGVNFQHWLYYSTCISLFPEKIE